MFALQYLTVALGCVALAFALFMFVYFIRSKYPIGKAVALMLLGESIGIAVTVGFSIFANGLYDCIGDSGSMFLRWVMFLTALATSLHLAYQTRLIELRAIKDDGNK